MTYVVYDGENMLVDKLSHITNPEWGYDNAGKAMGIHCENDCKLFFPKGDTFPSKLYGNDILVYSCVGSTLTEDNVLAMLNADDFDAIGQCDLRSLVDVAHAFPKGGVLTTETTHLFVDTSGTLCKLSMELSDDGKYRVVDRSWSVEKLKDIGPIAFGFGSKFLMQFEQQFFDRVFTAVECMVMAQQHFPILGRKFDHWHRPTGKLVKDIDLSDRQRKAILSKLMGEITIPEYAPVTTLQDLYRGK